ncbi:MAG: LysM peptidoglycan-binding domain-containing protein [Chloroflexi bacterium]|nr:MAG: LysM peptidoglycan-binding domain-containing protein [Chloroflexota bacterium]
MSVRRMLPFLLINIVVSAVVVLLILYWWESRNGDVVQAVVAETAVSTPIAFETAAIAQQAALAETSAPTATDGPPLHVVQAGDTLGTLSQLYDVSIDDIMAANGMSNPNLISIGQQLVIPVNGLETPEPVVVETTVPNQLPTPIATEPLPTGDVVIEISQVIGVGDLAQEAVQIRNVGSNPTALLDWKVADQNGNFYTFGQITLFGDGAGILLHSEPGQDGATEMYWGMSEPVWESGEKVTLLNAQDAIVATFAIP